jgi:hypothetical protein
MKLLITVLCSLLLCTTALAQQVVVVGPDLEPKTKNLDAVSLSDAGLLRLRISSDPVIPLNDKQYVARLVDGQSLVGTLLGAGKDGESIRLAFGYEQRTVVLPLDELLSLARVGYSLPGDTSDDTLLLATGETLVGFVDTFSEKKIGFVVGDAEDPIQIPMDRVRGFSIANKTEAIKMNKGLARVKLRGGSTLYLRDAKLKRATPQTPAALEGTFILEPKTAPITLPLTDVQLIEPLSERYTLQTLAENEMTTLEGGEVFGVAMPPTKTDNGAIRLHAPVTVGFDLPSGAERLAFTVEMDLDESIPESRRAMAGCELLVYDGDKVVGKHTLTPDGPAKRLNVPLTGGDLRIALKPGVNGPVLDRVLITQAELLVSE